MSTSLALLIGLVFYDLFSLIVIMNISLGCDYYIVDQIKEFEEEAKCLDKKVDKDF